MSSKPYTAPTSASKPIGAFFRWEIPGEAVGVHLSLNVIELLERDAARAGDKIAAGVLLGRTHHGRELTLTVEHFESATPERGASESPFANPEALAAMLDRWRPGRSRMSVLGFYRSSPEISALNASDMAAVQATLENTSGGLNGGASSTDAAPAANTAAPARSTIQDPERILLLIEPRAGRLSTASLYLARKGVVVCQSPRIPFNRNELAKTGTPTETQSPEPHRTPAYTPQDVAVPRETRPSKPRDAARKSVMPWTRYWRWALVGLSALPIALAVFISLHNNQIVPHPPAATGASSDSVLGLKLDRNGSAWKLSWDATSPSVRDATSGRLLITDGAVHRELELASSDLRGGTIFYTPMTDDVDLQLQIETPGAAEPLSASVRTLGTGVSLSATSMPSPGIPPLETSNVPPLDENALREAAARIAPPVPAPPNLARTAPISKFEKPVSAPLAPSKIIAAKLDTPRHIDATRPAAKAPAIVAAEDSPRARTITQNPAPAPQVAATVSLWPPNASETPSTSATTTSTDRTGAIEVARLVSRDDPVYPATAKELGLAGTVEVHFKIGKDGQVHDVSVVNGFDALGQAAVEAVQKWRYSPAKIDGVPTESEASAVFVFKRS